MNSLMDLIHILVFCCCLFDNVVVGKVHFDLRKLEQFLKGGKKLWSERPLTHDQINYYMHRGGSVVDIKELKRNAQPHPQSRLLFNNTMRHNQVELPDSFDARTHPAWRKCRDVISTIQNQARCENCWAVATSSVMSDRACIATKGASKPRISAIDLTRCCERCQISKGDGCKSGGIAAYAFDHFSEFGTVTGGPYESNEGCLPYPFPPTTHPVTQSSGPCEETCSNEDMDYEKERHYGMGGYFNPVGEEAMKRDIYEYGPIAASIEFHTELAQFHSDPDHNANGGIYHIIKRDFGEDYGTKSYHAIRILGWGYDVVDGKNVPYWIIANSWGPGWANGGTFKYLRGMRMGLIEDSAISGLYDYEKSPKCKKSNMCNIL